MQLAKKILLSIEMNLEQLLLKYEKEKLRETFESKNFDMNLVGIE